MSPQGTSVETGLQVQELLRWKERKVDDEQTDGNCHQKNATFLQKATLKMIKYCCPVKVMGAALKLSLLEHRFTIRHIQKFLFYLKQHNLKEHRRLFPCGRQQKKNWSSIVYFLTKAKIKYVY